MIKSFSTHQTEGTFVEDRIRLRSERKRTVIFLLSLIAILGWTYLFFFSDVFVVSKFEIEGIHTLSRGEVSEAVEDVMRQMRVWPMRNGNIFTLNEQEISNRIKNDLFAEAVTVDKIYPNILRLKIEERQSSLFMVRENRVYQIDRSGFVTRELNDGPERQNVLALMNEPSDSRGDMPPILEIKDQSEIIPGNQYVSEFRILMWLDGVKTLKEEGFGYRNAVLESATSSKLILNMYEPYEVYFDLVDPLKPQIESYYAFIRVKKDEPIGEYVDARIPGKIFYK